jgi:hypothetical protein
MSIATFSPALSTSAARSRSSSRGITRAGAMAPPENTEPCWRGGGENGSSCTSAGTISAVTERVAWAIRYARSTRCCAWAGAISVCTYSDATSL